MKARFYRWYFFISIKDINRLRPKVGIFQQFNLFPHMTVMENIALAPIKLRA